MPSDTSARLDQLALTSSEMNMSREVAMKQVKYRVKRLRGRWYARLGRLLRKEGAVDLPRMGSNELDRKSVV